MSIISTSVNYATPSFSSIVDEGYVDSARYFSLHDNDLTGTYVLLGAATPLWSAALSNELGVFDNPITITVERTAVLHTLRLLGDAAANVFPVSFSITLYNESTVLFSDSFTNTAVEWLFPLSETYSITKYAITIYAINKPGYTMRLINIFNPHFIARKSAITLRSIESSELSLELSLLFQSTLSIDANSQVSYFGNEVQSSALLDVTCDGIIAKTDITAYSLDSLILNSAGTSSVLNSFASSDIATISELTSTHVLNTFKALDVGEVLLVPAQSSVHNSFTVFDTLKTLLAEEPYLRNVHEAMKRPYRQIYGKAVVTYSNPLVLFDHTFDTSGDANGTSLEQTINGTLSSADKFLLLFNNKLDGTYSLIGDETEAGWISSSIADTDGVYVTPVLFSIAAPPRLLTSLTVAGNSAHNIFPVDFDVIVQTSTGSHTLEIRNNASVVRQVIIDSFSDVEQVLISVLRGSKALAPMIISELSIASIATYLAKDLVDIDLLEELSYTDDIGSMGGVSANELSVTFNNSSGEFYFNNDESLISKQLKKNRKIEAWLGVEIENLIEWYKLGVFWSYAWNVPAKGLTASVVAFDTIGLLGTMPFEQHFVYTNKSLGELYTIVLDSAKQALPWLDYVISPELFSIIIPTAWFDRDNHQLALNKLSECYPAYVYCDRDGVIQVRGVYSYDPGVFYDIWSESTNIYDTTYPTLYTEAPNSISVVLHQVHIEEADLVTYSSSIAIDGVAIVELVFSEIAQSVDTVTIEHSGTLSYGYEWYSWGIIVHFEGIGEVTSIQATGHAIKISQKSFISKRNEAAVQADGLSHKEIVNSFVQTPELASFLAERLVEVSAQSKFAADTAYRGDISLAISDPIKLAETIATSDRYVIKRHALFWNGSLSGTAYLTT